MSYHLRLLAGHDFVREVTGRGRSERGERLLMWGYYLQVPESALASCSSPVKSGGSPARFFRKAPTSPSREPVAGGGWSPSSIRRHASMTSAARFGQ
jgi:hypothetical protein